MVEEEEEQVGSCDQSGGQVKAVAPSSMFSNEICSNKEGELQYG